MGSVLAIYDREVMIARYGHDDGTSFLKRYTQLYINVTRIWIVHCVKI